MLEVQNLAEKCAHVEAASKVYVIVHASHNCIECRVSDYFDTLLFSRPNKKQHARNYNSSTKPRTDTLTNRHLYIASLHISTDCHVYIYIIYITYMVPTLRKTAVCTALCQRSISISASEYASAIFPLYFPYIVNISELSIADL